MTKIPLIMNADELYSSLSRAQKREKLTDLIERRKSGKRPAPKERDTTNIKSYEKGSMKRKKLNSLFYKRFIRMRRKKVKVLNDINDRHTPAAESCSRKKQRFCDGQGCGERVHPSGTKDKITSGSSELADFQFEVSTEMHNHILPYVNKLHDHRNRGQHAVIFDGQERLVKVVSFVSSLLDNTKKPVLIIASLGALSLWETKFSRWSKLVNAVTYQGDKDARAAIRGSDFQVLVSSLDAIVEDMEMLDHIKWEMLVIDECQRSVFSTHLKKIQNIMADMKLLTVSGESVDICKSYKHILSIVDPKYEKTPTGADMEMNDDINTLKERLSAFIAFECKFSTPDLDEYWVPVHLSCMQIEQYCSILASNSDTLSTSLRSSPLHDILTEIQKCCDHPFLADPTLRTSSKEASLVGPLDAEINVSGKLQILDKLLLEIKRCGLRALVLFHSSVNSEKISTGHILDDVVHQRFGENSYVYIPGRILTNSSPVKRKELLEMFNNADSERFVCLCDYRACYSSIRLSRLDVVILFNSDRNPSNDIKALKRITIDPRREQLNILRLYSPFTVEEKALILSKQGTPVDTYVSWRVCHQLLGWGAPYLLCNLQSSTDSRQSFIDDLVHEMSSLLRNTGVKPSPTKCSMLSQVVTPAESMLLFGETETHATESLSIDEYLIHNTQSVFWNKLVKESQPGREKSCNRLSRRVQKRARNRIEGENATTPSLVRSKPRTKRKLLKNAGRKWAGTHTPFGTHQACENATPSTALNPVTNGGQQSQTDQPPLHTLETEIERIQKEREQIAKSQEEKESILLAECEKEISEIRKKYDGLIHDSKTCSTNEDIILEEYEKLVNVNKLLAEFLSQHWQDTPILKKAQKETSAVKVLQIPTYVPVWSMDPCLTGGPTTYFPGSGLRFAAPHLRSSPPLFAPLHDRLNYYEPSIEPFPTLSTVQIVDKHCPV